MQAQAGLRPGRLAGLGLAAGPRGGRITPPALLIVALQTWIAVRWRSFTVAVSVGMSATVMGFLIGQSERFGHWYPWSMPMQVLAGKGQCIWASCSVAGLAGGLLVAAARPARISCRREFS